MARMIGRIEVGATEADGPAGHPRIRIRVRDTALAQRLEEGVAAGLAAVLAEDPPLPELPTVRVSTLAHAPRTANGIAILAVTRRTGRRLLALAEAAEAAGAAGIQVVWNGRAPELEAAVFRVLEAWRGTARRCPLVLAPNSPPAEALRRAIARFRRGGSPP